MKVSLRDTADLLIDGDWIESKDQDPNGEVRLIQLADIGIGCFLDRSARFLTKESSMKLKCTYLNPGDVLIARMPDPIGRACIFPDLNQQCVTAVDVTILRPRKGVSAEYLVNWINQPDFRYQVLTLSKGATRQRISRKNLENLLVFLPTAEEQAKVNTQIRESMDRVREIRSLRSESLKEAQALLGAVIEDIFREAGGDEVSLADVATIEGKLVDPREVAYKNMLHVGGANIVSETGELINMLTAEEEKLISGKFVFNDKDVLYSKIRPYLKKVARPDFTGLCSADMYPLRPAEGRLHRDYLFFLLLSRDFTNYAIKVSNRAGMPKVNREQLFAYRFNLPSYQKQTDVIEKLNESMQAVLAMVAEMKEAVSESDFIQQSILKKAFAGEL